MPNDHKRPLKKGLESHHRAELKVRRRVNGAAFSRGSGVWVGPRLLAACLLLTTAGLLRTFGGEDSAPGAGVGCPGLKDTTVLIIRHAEKPASGRELNAQGRLRAQAYAQYFKGFRIGSRASEPDYLMAAADSEGSERPRLTLEPLSLALGKKLDLRFKAKEDEKLAAELCSKPHGKCILICWHHGKIPALARDLGADPRKLLPDGAWPEREFSWILELRYDAEGRLIPQSTERLPGMPPPRT